MPFECADMFACPGVPESNPRVAVRRGDVVTSWTCRERQDAHRIGERVRVSVPQRFQRDQVWHGPTQDLGLRSLLRRNSGRQNAPLTTYDYVTDLDIVFQQPVTLFTRQTIPYAQPMGEAEQLASVGAER